MKNNFNIKEKASWLRNQLMLAKIYVSRSMSYISLINTAILVYLGITNFNKVHGFTISGWYSFPIVITLAILVLSLGWLEVKMKFFSVEQRITADINPRIVQILNKLDSIEEKVIKLEEKGNGKKD